MRKMLQQINKAPLTPDLLGAAMEAVASLSEEDRQDMTARMLAVIRTLDDAPDAHRTTLGMAITFRLTALAHLMASDELAGFRMPSTGDGPDLLHADVVRTAVEVPLRSEGDDLRFDPTEFREHLLTIASPAGEA